MASLEFRLARFEHQRPFGPCVREGKYVLLLSLTQCFLPLRSQFPPCLQRSKRNAMSLAWVSEDGSAGLDEDAVRMESDSWFLFHTWTPPVHPDPVSRPRSRSSVATECTHTVSSQIACLVAPVRQCGVTLLFHDRHQKTTNVPHTYQIYVLHSSSMLARSSGCCSSHRKNVSP